MTRSPADIVVALDSASAHVSTPSGAGHMAWRIWGDGPALVLLHGASGSWTHWIHNIAGLARRFRVIVPDMPGHGDSDMPDLETWGTPGAPQAPRRSPGPGSTRARLDIPIPSEALRTAEGLADIVATGLDIVAPPPTMVDIAGFSLGGIVGGIVAARRPERIRALVLIGPNGMALPNGRLPALARLRADMTADEVRAAHRTNLGILMIADPARVDALAVHVQMENVRRARFKAGGIPTSDVLLRALPSVKARIAGIWGELDAFTGAHLDERRRVLAAFQADLDFRVLHGVGHWAPYEAPEQVDAALIEILTDGA